MIYVITPTIAGRGDLLAECVASVAAQEADDVTHIIGMDVRGNGPAEKRNQLVPWMPHADDWVTFLDDDDVWNADHVDILRAHMAGYDVVYTLAEIEGRPGWDPQQDTFDPERLRQVNYIPLCGVAIRAQLFHQVGGFPTEGLYEDHGLLVRLLDAGARFKCIPVRSWRYRFGDWDSRSKEVWRGERTA